MPPRQSIPTTTTTTPTAAPPTGSPQPTAAAGDVVTQLADLLGISPEEAAALLTGGGAGMGQDPFAVFTSNFADPTMAVFSRRLQPTSRGSRVFGVDVPQSSLTPRAGTSRVFQVDVPFFEIADTTDTVGDLLQSFYTWDRQQLMDRQRQLYAAGFYGNVDIADVNWGQHDEDSFVAWAQAVTRAARFFAAGEKITVDGVLKQAAKERLGGLGSDGAGGDGRVVSLSDPVGLYQMLDSTAQSVLGRKATAQEQRMFVGVVHQLQRDSQLAAQPVSRSGQQLDVDRDGQLSEAELEAALASSGGPGGVTEIVQPSPEAQAESLLRQQNPTEAGAHDIAASFTDFIGLLRGIV